MSLGMHRAYLNSHGLGKPLDDRQQRIGCKHRSLITLSVDDLARSDGGCGEPSVQSKSSQTHFGVGGS